MNSRKYSIVFVALALLGAGAWWAMSREDTRNTEIPDQYEPSDTSTTVDVSPPSPQPTVVENDSDTGPAEEVSSAANASEPIVGPERREFESRVDSDPALSRELETVVQRSLDAKLDRSKMDVESLICRGNSCQILLATPPQAAGPGGMSVVSTVLRDLNDASIRNPSTGEQLKPMVQMVSARRGDSAGIVAVFAFEAR